MNIVIAGGSGFLGTALIQALVAERHDVTILTRQNPPPAARPHVSSVSWTPNGSSGGWATSVNGADAVINLAGESIAGKRWSNTQKQKLRDSRLQATRSLTTDLRQS